MHSTITSRYPGRTRPGYRNAGYVQNFAVYSFDVYPGIPFFVNGAPAFLQVQDRDVILARSDVATTNVALPCLRVSEDGCNFNVDLRSARSVPSNRLPCGGRDDQRVGYRFFNTHLEVQAMH